MVQHSQINVQAFKEKDANSVAGSVTLKPVSLGSQNGGQINCAPPIFLAPMSGVSDAPFRALVRRFGAPIVVSEMIASSELLRNYERSHRRSQPRSTDGDMVVQLAGGEPDIMAEAARIAVDQGARVIDINFGCPAKKITRKLCGSALMREPDLAIKIVEAVVGAVSLPVTVKMRLGWDTNSLNAPELAQSCANVGAQMITVHGRTRMQLYTGSASWSAVQDTVHRAGVPVIVNGDIVSCLDLYRALAASGAVGAMIGRGCLGRPWRLGQMVDAVSGKCPHPDLRLEDRIPLIMEHHAEILHEYGYENGMRIARKHLGWYMEAAAEDCKVECPDLIRLRRAETSQCVEDELLELMECLSSVREPSISWRTVFEPANILSTESEA